MRYHPNFYEAIHSSINSLVNTGVLVDTGHWQGVSTEGRPDLQTIELSPMNWSCPFPQGTDGNHPEEMVEQLQQLIEPNLPWADEHFGERVGGVAMNPDPSHERWPFWRGQDSTTKDSKGKFTHTYSERFWPVEAWENENGKYAYGPVGGIRFQAGDFNSLINLLRREPFTRQAYLPIFFPEDTGAVHGGRIPCTLGYNFFRRFNILHIHYFIRSCDAYRHFRDDVYLAARLVPHILYELRADPGWQDVQPGMFHFYATSFHIHRGDMHHVKRSG